MSLIKSPLRYPGGKSRAVQFLSDFIPPFDEFREVFFGGGSLTFYCIQKFTDKKFTASDLNYELHCFWSQLKSNSRGLVKEVQKVYNKYKTDEHEGADGKKLFNKLVERRNSNLTELQRAVDFYILNRITFSGVVDSGGYSQGSFEKRFTQSSIDRLVTAASIIRDVDFTCENYSYLLNKKGKNVFLFLDPPYYTATKSKLYGKNGILHTQFNHEQLKKDLDKTNHKWLITYDNSSFIKDLYKDYYRQEWQLQYGMTNRESLPGNELLIANYDLNQTRQYNREKAILENAKKFSAQPQLLSGHEIF